MVLAELVGDGFVFGIVTAIVVLVMIIVLAD